MRCRALVTLLAAIVAASAAQGQPAPDAGARAPGAQAADTRATGAQTSRAPSAQPPATGDSALEARTSALASQLRCPVCQGLSIQDSPSELAQSMRAVARDQLAQGKTPDEVKAYFVSKYGEWILLAPKPSGFNMLAYLLPLLIIAGGGALLTIAVRRWTRAPERATEP